ncbi:MAG TPA: response regulator transcription factor [Oculatellaceae cyanobacterium]
MIRILIVDDQNLVREGMASLLSLEEDLEVIGQASNGEEACQLADTLSPDVVLMDVRMPVCDGVTASGIIHSKHPKIKIIVLTTFDEEEYIMLALQRGASGYLLKDTPSEQVAAVIRSVFAGHTLLGPTITPKVLSHLTAVRSEPKKADYTAILTTREIDVLKLLGQGKSNREISRELNITEGTVKNHITKIFNQVGVRDRTQAALWVQQNL